MKIVEKPEQVTQVKVKKAYVADDGTEFNSYEDCYLYEVNLKLDTYIKKYNIRESPYIEGITENSISYLLTYTGNKDDFIDCISILQNCALNKDMKANYRYSFDNVCGSDLSLDKLKKETFKEGETYLFTVCWEGECDTYDIYYWLLYSAKDAFERVRKTVSTLEKAFNVKYNEVE